MERYRLKNIIILILLLLNVFLLVSLSFWSSARNTARRTSADQIVSLFSADGVSLDPDAIPADAARPQLIFNRDHTRESSAAQLFLGGDLNAANRGGGIYAYSNSVGTARFRDTGSFDIVGSWTKEETEDLCRSFCRKFGFTAPELSDGGNAMTATGLYRGQSIYNCTVTFSLADGALQSVSGTLLPEKPTADDTAQVLSLIGALTAFQQMRRDTGAVVSSITEISPCYEAQSSAAVPISLAPAWSIRTDTAVYYVNCITGEVHLF